MQYRPTEAELAKTPHSKTIAIFVPLWREYHASIRNMIEHNVVTPRYDRCDFFIGVYPTTSRRWRPCASSTRASPMSTWSVCPHDGPTSKADNLNWVFQHMILFEAEHGVRFEIVMTHDAEDLLHPEELRWVNYYGQRYDMVQIPVLPLPTLWAICSTASTATSSPSTNAGTCPRGRSWAGFSVMRSGHRFSRRALDRLAAAHSNCIFEPKCLTEDYENGFRLHRLGCSQVFVPVTKFNGTFVAIARLLPAPFPGGGQTAHPLDHRHRAAILGIARMARNARTALLVLARSQRPGRLAAVAGRQSGLSLWSRSWYADGMGVDASRLFLDSVALDHRRFHLLDDAAGHSSGRADAILGADLWMEVRLARSGPRRLRKRDQFPGDR